jgi:hypothetical protein
MTGFVGDYLKSSSQVMEMPSVRLYGRLQWRLGATAIAKTLGIGRASVYRVLEATT